MDILEEIVRLADGDGIIVAIGTRSGVVVVRGTVERVLEARLHLYSQNDPRWASYQIAPGRTMGGYGCYITCIAMFLPLAGYWDTPPQVAERLRNAGVLQDALVAKPERIALAYPGVRFVARYDWANVPADVSLLGEEWRKGRQVLLEVEFSPGGSRPPADQHFVLLYQWEENPYVADPYDGVVRRLLPRYGLPSWDAARAIYGARIFEVGRR